MKFVFKSLISNEAAITGAKKHKWWVALLIILFSIIVAIVPSFVQSISTQGDSIFSSSSFGLDVAFTNFVDQCDQLDYDLTIKNHKFSSTAWSEGSSIDFTPEGEANADAEFYWTTGDVLAFAQPFATAPYTVVIFGEDEFFLHLANPQTEKVVGENRYLKAYQDYEDCNLAEVLLGKVDNKVSLDGTWKNIKGFFVKANNYQRVTTSFSVAGIYAAINVVVTFLMGLMVFILTRGKTNAFRSFSFWDGQKIAYWSSISPAILGLIFGFLIPSFASMSFVLFMGVRVMWLTMKQLRPDGTGYSLPKDLVKTVNVKSVK